MSSIVKNSTLNDLFTPTLSPDSRRKIEKFQNLETPNGFSVAYGMLLKAVKKDFISLEEVQGKFNDYLRKFYSNYYMVPKFGPYCSLEKKLDQFVEYDYIEERNVDSTLKYKITEKGERLLGASILDEEIMNLFD